MLGLEWMSNIPLRCSLQKDVSLIRIAKQHQWSVNFQSMSAMSPVNQWIQIPGIDRGGATVKRKIINKKSCSRIIIFFPPKKRKTMEAPWHCGCCCWFWKEAHIGVLVSCLLWSKCISMAGQRTQLTVERVRKKGPAPVWIVGFCLLSKFTLPSVWLLQMGWGRERESEGEGWLGWEQW